MDVRLHARNMTIDDGFRSVVEDKVGHAGRVFDHNTSVDVELFEQQNPRRSPERFRIELSSSIAGRFVRIASDASTPEAALDDAVERFTRQLRRMKERTIDSRRKPTQAIEETPAIEMDDVVRTKQFVMKPMTIDEAALQMDLLGHDFFFFHNAGTEKQSVLYRRRDGRLGLIEPA